MISAISSLDQGRKSLILLRNGEFAVQNLSPKEIIHQYFNEYGVCYEGNRKVSCKLLGIRQKAPASLSYIEEIIFFPTHSPDNKDCCFVNAANVRRVVPYRKRETKVEFINNYVIFPMGVRSIRNQMKRCDVLINRKIDYEKFKIN